MSVHTLMFGWEYPPLHLGGLGVACQGLVRGLLNHNVKVTLALPHPDGQEGDVDILHPTEKHYEHLEQTIRVQSLLGPYDTNEEYIARAKRTFSSEASKLKDIYGTDLYEAIANFSALSVEMTKHVQADVVHCHDWMTYDAAARAAAHHDKPMVAHIHATELDRTHFSPNEWIYQTERRGFERADRIIAVSNYTKGVLSDHYGIRPDKISVVHNGSGDLYDDTILRLKSERMQNKNRHPMILFLGRLALQKGAWQFLDMAAQIHRTRPEVRFVMAGDGHMLGELIDRACELGIQHVVQFAGKVNGQEARRLYGEADCFVMPSLSEPFGLVALEAIAHGTPVILSRQSGVCEVVSHSFVVDFWDTAKMADCALTILREPHLAEQLRSEAPHILRQLTWANQAGHVRGIYSQLV